MPTKEELQDEVDELRIALEETREAAESDLGEAQGEITKLRADLQQSESQRRQLQSTLETLNETRQTLAALYEEKEERLLAGVQRESTRMAAVGERWAAREAELREELEQSTARIAELGTETESRRTQLATQAGWLVQLQRELREEKRLGELKDLKIRGFETQLARTGEQLRLASEARGESMVVGIIELLISRPGCWAVMAFLAGILAAIFYVVNSILDWLKPSENLLGQ